jgi:hypothetical protein
MKNTYILTALALGGCAGPPPAPGEPLAAVKASLGQPSAVYHDGADTLLEYATGPMGQTTRMARIGADGRLISLQQVLTDQQFGTIAVGVATRQDVLRIVGRPAETSWLARQKLEVWSYRYKGAGVWDSMMHVHFDQSGVVRMLQSGPDPEREEHRSFFR